MHTFEMAQNLRNVDHLSRCELHPATLGNGFKIITVSQDAQGGKRQELTNSYGETIITILENAVDYAKRIGFEEEQIETVKASKS